MRLSGQEIRRLVRVTMSIFGFSRLVASGSRRIIDKRVCIEPNTLNVPKRPKLDFSH